MRLRLALTITFLVVLHSAGPAAASVPGGFTQLPGTAGCVSNGGTGGCTVAHDLATNAKIAISPDGRNAYVTTSMPSDTLLVFDRNAQTGQLTQKAGQAGCIHIAAATANCASAPLMHSPDAMAFAPDGRTFYVAAQQTARVLTFTRDPATGIVTQKDGEKGCISSADPNPPCRSANGIFGPTALEVSPDGKQLYVAGGFQASGAVTALAIDGDTGELSQISDGPGGTGCVRDTASAGCVDGRALGTPDGLGLGPDGTTLYVATNVQKGGVTALKRDPASGRLSVINGTAGCVVAADLEGCDILPELGFASDVAVDGDRVYVATSTGPAERVVALDRLQGGGIRRHAGAGGCVSSTAFAGCSTGRALGVFGHLALSRDGADLYAISPGDGLGLVELDRAAGGDIAARPDVRGCAVFGALANCAPIAGLTANTVDVAVSPDGHHLYAISSTQNGGQIVAFKRDSAGPVCGASAVTVQAGSATPLAFPCNDADGDQFNVSIVNPPTLGNLGAVDNAAHTVVYAAPQAQNGTTTITFQAAYPDGSFASPGSIAVTVVGATGTGGLLGIDNDHDGFFAGQDCNDASAAIRPGALEIRGNRVDENCDGISEPFLTVASGLSTNWDVHGSRLTLTGLTITQVPAKTFKAEIRCLGKGCPFKRRALTGKVRSRSMNVLASLSKRQRRFRAKQTLQVWISAPGLNTKVAQLQLKAGKLPKIVPLCVPPGAVRPQTSCT